MSDLIEMYSYNVEMYGTEIAALRVVTEYLSSFTEEEVHKCEGIASFRL